MKRIVQRVIWVALLASATLSGWAQETDRQRRFVAAPIAGFNMSQIDGDDLFGYRKIGLAAGARVSAILAPRWRLAMEIQFLQQGSRRGKNEAAGLDRIQLNAVEVPFFVQFLEWKFQINAGVSYARVINYEITDVFGAEVTDDFEYASDLFFIAGGITFMFTDRFGADLRLSRALTNLNAQEGAGTLISRNITVRALYEF